MAWIQPPDPKLGQTSFRLGTKAESDAPEVWPELDALRKRARHKNHRAAVKSISSGSPLKPDSAVSFGDLVGKLRIVRVECTKCGWGGSYSLGLLIRERGRSYTVLDWKDMLTSNCPRRINEDDSYQCGARCPDLLKVL
jgi:hypothetical protein